MPLDLSICIAYAVYITKRYKMRVLLLLFIFITVITVITVTTNIYEHEHKHEHEHEREHERICVYTIHITVTKVHNAHLILVYGLRTLHDEPLFSFSSHCIKFALYLYTPTYICMHACFKDILVFFFVYLRKHRHQNLKRIVTCFFF